MTNTRNEMWARTIAASVAYYAKVALSLLFIFAPQWASALTCNPVDRDGISSSIYSDRAFLGTVSFTDFAKPDDVLAEPSGLGRQALLMRSSPTGRFKARLTGHLATANGFNEPYDKEHIVTTWCPNSDDCDRLSKCKEEACSILPDDIDRLLTYIPAEGAIGLALVCRTWRVDRDPSQEHIDRIVACLADPSCIERRSERTAYRAAQLNQAAQLLEDRTALIGTYGQVRNIMQSFAKTGIKRDIKSGPYMDELDEYLTLNATVEFMGEELGADLATSGPRTFHFAVRHQCRADYGCGRAFEQEWKAAKLNGKLAEQSGALHPSQEVKECLVQHCEKALVTHLSGPALLFHKRDQDRAKIDAWIAQPSEAERLVLEACLADDVCRAGGLIASDDRRVLDFLRLESIDPVSSRHWPELFFGEHMPRPGAGCADDNVQVRRGTSFGGVMCLDLHVQRTE